MTSTTGLSAHRLTVGYHGSPAVLHDADITLAPGRRVALIGANGSGKTTLLRTLAGSIEPFTGTVAVNGVPLRHGRRALNAHRGQVQLVLQDPDDQLFSADVYADVSFGPTNLGLSPNQVRQRVEDTLDLLGIRRLSGRPVHHLSHGERKRVAIAGAVAMQPRYLLLDEPTAGLDPAGTESLLQALDRLEAVGTSIMLATHELALVWEWADEVALVNAGTVVVAPTDQILTDANLLESASLRLPWQATMLTRAGHSFSAGPFPRSEVAVAEAVRVAIRSDRG